MDALPNAATSARTQHLDDDDGGIIDELPLELPLELQPQFTEQDEHRELATLTIQELTALQSDLTGIQAITNGFSGLGLVSGGTSGDTCGINVYGGENHFGEGPPTVSPLSTPNLALAALDQHMTTLPADSTAAYFMATAKCPDEVSNERKLLFLQREENSVPLAAQRLALYWECRLDGFGKDKCFDPMTLMGAMRDEITNMAMSGLYQLMPNTDASGRAIIYCRLRKRDLLRYSVRQEFMWLTYLLEVVVQQNSLRNKGFVLLIDASNGTRKNYSSQVLQCLHRTIEVAFPTIMRSIHVCNASPLVNYVIFPVAMRVLSKNARLRTRLHRDSGDNLLRSLVTFHLPPDRLPSDMGGSVVLDINQFLIDRITLEASQAGINLLPAEQVGSPDDAGFGGKRQKLSEETENVDQAERSSSALSSAVSHHSAALGTATGTCAVGGRHLPLSSPSDETYLSPLVCLIRSQIEIFSATEADVHARAALGGVVQTIKPGRVGIRCIHCWDRPAKERANGAVGYPASIRVLNQAVRNWQRFHWLYCAFIPPSVREEFERLNSGKKTYSSKKSKEYWIHRCEEMGLVDVSANMIEGSGDSEGIYFEADARTLGLRVLVPPELKEGAKKAGVSGMRKKAAPGNSNNEDTGDESDHIIAAKKATMPISNETGSAMNVKRKLGGSDSKKNADDKSTDNEKDVASILLHFKQSA